MNMSVLAIDPGTKQSALVEWDNHNILYCSIHENDELLKLLPNFKHVKACLIEMIASYGLRVGQEVFETCRFIGKLEQACSYLQIPTQLIYRKDIKLHFCNSVKANDSTIRQALINRYPKGNKRSPGVTHKLVRDMWQAFAIAVYATENNLYI